MSTHSAAGEFHPTSDQVLSSTLAASAHSFLQPTPALQTASLVLAKRFLHPLALSAIETQNERLQALRQTRKGRGIHDHAPKRPFRIRQVHLEGLRTQQIWEQARRILDASTQEVEIHLQSLSPAYRGGSDDFPRPFDSSQGDGPQRKRVRFNDDDSGGSDVVPDGSDGETSSQDRSGNAGLQHEADGMIVNASDGDFEHENPGTDEENEDITLDSDASSGVDEHLGQHFLPDKHGLNDGFFSIDDFNQHSELLETQDARGERDNDTGDEEEIDWGAEPAPLQGDGDLEDEDASGEDGSGTGPTFRNADLQGVHSGSDASDSGMDVNVMGASTNTNDIMYADFFAPPPRKAAKSIRMRTLPEVQPVPSLVTQQGDDIHRTVAAVRRDIFDDAVSLGEDSDPASNAVPGGLRSRRSNHEERQAKLAKEIRKLEAANVAKREWTLSGEARATDRPLNSLLEEDLEFERAGRPVPVITNEVSEDIEALIRRRIINREFDEVIRRRPGDLATGIAAARRGRFELDDTKPQQSLAEVYETAHLKKANPEGHVDKRDEKVKKEHAAIESLWADISAKLDSLSNWHYKPKPVQANISVVADVAKVSMEDARPSAGGEMGPEESMLAPQEVYKPGEERPREAKHKEVVLKSGVPVAREEMNRGEKLRRRRREKERIRKKGGSVVPKAATAGVKKAAEKEGIVGDLKRGGVRVIGKKGEIVDTEGKGIRGGKGVMKGVGSFRL
ncbi:MAG: hypothetical protein Q9170_000774 [Blastenia crenularia]